jgi:hypothetical protein
LLFFVSKKGNNSVNTCISKRVSTVLCKLLITPIEFVKSLKQMFQHVPETFKEMTIFGQFAMWKRRITLWNQISD